MKYDYTMKTRYYIPSKFRIAKHSFDDIWEISLKNNFGKYMNNSKIKMLCGYNIKDTGEGELDKIEREITGNVKEFDNIYYQHITIDNSKLCVYHSDKIVLQHQLDFQFTLNVFEFLSSPFAYSKIISETIGKHTLNGDFIFAVNPNNQVCMLSKQEVEDTNKNTVITEDQYNMYSSDYIHTKDLKIGTVYRYYGDNNRLKTIQEYQRLLYLGEFDENAIYLVSDVIQNNNHGKYLVFLDLSFDFELSQENMKKLKYVVMKNSTRRLRQIDDDQSLVTKSGITIDCQNAIRMTQIFIPIEKRWIYDVNS